MLNTGKIKDRLKELGLTQIDVAKVLKIKQSTANLKINNRRGLTLDEANKISHLLKLKPDDFNAYFFNQ